MSLPACRRSRQPHRFRQRFADLIEQVDWTGLPFTERLYQRHALLKLRAPRLELRDLLNDVLEPLGLAFGFGNLLVEIGRLALKRPEPPAHDERREQRE